MLLEILNRKKNHIAGVRSNVEAEERAAKEKLGAVNEIASLMETLDAAIDNVREELDVAGVGVQWTNGILAFQRRVKYAETELMADLETIEADNE